MCHSYSAFSSGMEKWKKMRTVFHEVRFEYGLEVDFEADALA
ncbi:hypothetical protein PR003_g25631 [Phytophthora rubi]|uniref:Uncharacterized protein n=1 Tax=Phytophthora rubi TaxID=129364 RepID=A0A6A4CMT9_9STRA|nr:hypothetical protein PR003_g25631 [Phytophthora rubi]